MNAVDKRRPPLPPDGSIERIGGVPVRIRHRLGHERSPTPLVFEILSEDGTRVMRRLLSRPSESEAQHAQRVGEWGAPAETAPARPRVSGTVQQATSRRGRG